MAEINGVHGGAKAGGAGGEGQFVEFDVHTEEGLAKDAARQIDRWANIELNWHLEAVGGAEATPKPPSGGGLFDGGKKATPEVSSSDRCDIPRVKSRRMSPSIFLENYYLKGPVIVEGASSLWPATERWRRAVLMERRGSQTVKVRACSCACLFALIRARCCNTRWLSCLDTQTSPPPHLAPAPARLGGGHVITECECSLCEMTISEPA